VADRPGVDFLLLRAARQANILPLTSTCNLRCVFCSHRQNPPDLEVFRIPHRTPAQAAALLPYLDSRRPVVIGESVTRIIEGEPFTHPEILDLLTLVRREFPGTEIRITTNGNLLDGEVVRKLAELRPVEVCLSLNSADPAVRRRLMGDPQPERAIAAVRLLAGAGIPFHGSVVAMPHVTGWADLEATLRYLAQNGARTIRVFLPGWTRHARCGPPFRARLASKIRRFVTRWRRRNSVPVTAEPPALDNLRPEVAGVVRDSPAWRAGLRAGDVVLAVGDRPVPTRVAAFRAAAEAAHPELTVARGGRVFRTRLGKGADQPSGLVMEYDLDPEVISWVERVTTARRARRVLVLTGFGAAAVLARGVEALYCGAAEVRVAAVPNRFFGGNITAAGLLTVADMERALADYLASHPGWRPDVVLLPARAFDGLGRDLLGRHFMELADRFGVEVAVPEDCAAG